MRLLSRLLLQAGGETSVQSLNVDAVVRGER